MIGEGIIPLFLSFLAGPCYLTASRIWFGVRIKLPLFLIFPYRSVSSETLLITLCSSGGPVRPGRVSIKSLWYLFIFFYIACLSSESPPSLIHLGADPLLPPMQVGLRKDWHVTGVFWMQGGHLGVCVWQVTKSEISLSVSIEEDKDDSTFGLLHSTSEETPSNTFILLYTHNLIDIVIGCSLNR